ncbi:MAG: aminotransferase class I/II-fold pyridoxal phosphate-dependent enzyme [Planctomycetota bacterium]
MWFGARPPRSLLEFGLEGCLAFHSLSKRSGMTGYRSAIVCGDPALVAEYRRCRAAMGQAMPAPTEAASVAAWGDEAHVEDRRGVFRAKRDLVLGGLAALGLEVWPNETTFYVWVKVPAGHDDRSYTDLLLDAGIVASPGSFFGAGNEEWFRLALVPDLDGCRRALEAWPR